MEATYPPRHVRQIKASTAALATIQADGSVVFPDAVLQSAAIAPMSNPRMFSVFKPQMQPLPCASWVMALWPQRLGVWLPCHLVPHGWWKQEDGQVHKVSKRECVHLVSFRVSSAVWDQMALPSLWGRDGSCDRWFHKGSSNQEPPNGSKWTLLPAHLCLWW